MRTGIETLEYSTSLSADSKDGDDGSPMPRQIGPSMGGRLATDARWHTSVERDNHGAAQKAACKHANLLF